MAHLWNYEIGTSLEEMVNVEEYLSDISRFFCTKGMAVVRWPVVRTSVSGKTYGDGFPTTEWVFDYLTPEKFDKLMDFIGDGNQSNTVYIRTRKDDGTYGLYSAIMHRPIPKQDMSWTMGGWQNVRVKFTHLVEIIES